MIWGATLPRSTLITCPLYLETSAHSPPLYSSAVQPPLPPVQPRLIGLDLDGTVLGPRGELSPAMLEALLAFRAAGIELAFLTGRRPSAKTDRSMPFVMITDRFRGGPRDRSQAEGQCAGVRCHHR